MLPIEEERRRLTAADRETGDHFLAGCLGDARGEPERALAGATVAEEHGDAFAGDQRPDDLLRDRARLHVIEVDGLDAFTAPGDDRQGRRWPDDGQRFGRIDRRAVPRVRLIHRACPPIRGGPRLHAADSDRCTVWPQP